MNDSERQEFDLIGCACHEQSLWQGVGAIVRE